MVAATLAEDVKGGLSVVIGDQDEEGLGLLVRTGEELARGLPVSLLYRHDQSGLPLVVLSRHVSTLQSAVNISLATSRNATNL